jgi:HSP20 family protein
MQTQWGHRTIWTELENLSQQMGQAFAQAVQTSREDMMGSIYPFVDVIEKDDELWVYAELPGQSKESVTLQVEEDTLTISGESPVSYGENVRFIRRERYSGKFKRTVRVNYHLDTERISAEFRDGILIVHLPRHQKTRARTVTINVN